MYFKLVQIIAQKFIGLINYTKKLILIDYILRTKVYIIQI